MNLIYGCDQAVAEWVCRHAPHAEMGFKNFVAVGIEDGGELIAGWVFNDYHGHTIQVSMASTTPRWASRRMLYAIFVYPFGQLNCKRLTACTGKTMTHVREFLTRLGFVEEGTLRQGFNDDDCVVYGMLREECRWVPELKEEIHGQPVQQRRSAAAA